MEEGGEGGVKEDDGDTRYHKSEREAIKSNEELKAEGEERFSLVQSCRPHCPP